jgi:hypothetical protein
VSIGVSSSREHTPTPKVPLHYPGTQGLGQVPVRGHGGTRRHTYIRTLAPYVEIHDYYLMARVEGQDRYHVEIPYIPMSRALGTKDVGRQPED